MEVLTEECRAKTVLSESLRRAHEEQQTRLQEARAQVEKQAREIGAKEAEISVAKQMYEDLKSKFSEKELALKHLNLAHEKLRAGFAEKTAELEAENKLLLSALDEAKAKGEERDELIFSFKQDIERLKGLLSMSQKKCIDAEERAQAPREVRRRDEMIARLERDKGEVDEQLKWRTEQFRHLEEAYEKIQAKFRGCKKEWEMERSNLVDEVSSLQTSLDSQTRVAEDLRSQLQMCNQALAHEESRRKLLEIQMCESKALYDNVMSAYEEARTKFGSLIVKRDEEVAEMRNSLTTKVTLAKELEFRAAHLEQENEELRLSLKELQGAQINGVGAAASFKTLQQKFRALEQAHRGCSEKLKTRDAEWSRTAEKLSNELEDYLFQLHGKDKQLQNLQAEVEVSHSMLMQQRLENEEIYMVLMIIKSKFLELCSNLEELKYQSEQDSKKSDERIRVLNEQLEKKNSDLARAQAEVKRERETIDSLLSKASESVEQEYHLMQKEINSYKEMLEESTRNLEQLKEQAVHKESDLLRDLKEALAVLDQANSALAEKSKQLGDVEFELEQSRFVAERMEKMKCNLEVELDTCRDEILLMRRDLEDSLLVKVKAEKDLDERKESFLQTLREKDRKIEDLQQLVLLLEEDKLAFEAKLESEKSSKNEKEMFLQFVDELDRRLRLTQSAVDSLEQSYVIREIEALMKLEEERMRSKQIVEEKEKEIADMQQKILSYDIEFTRSIETAAKLRNAELNLCALNGALEKTVAALEMAVAVHVLDEQEIFYRNILVAELEKELHALQLKAEFDEKLSFGLQNCLHELEVNLETVMIAKKKDQFQFEKELRGLLSNKMALEMQVEELEAKNKALDESILQLSSDREELVNQMMGFGDLIGNIYDKGEEIRRNWDRVALTATDVSALEVVDIFNSRKLEGRNLSSPSKNKAGEVLDRRSPLKEHNC